MPPAPLSDKTRALLREISTATLTSQLMARGLRNTFMRNVSRLTKGGGSMVGEAFTLRYIPSREDIDVSAVFENHDHPQRKAVETVPSGHVLVIDCRQDNRAAGAGSITPFCTSPCRIGSIGSLAAVADGTSHRVRTKANASAATDNVATTVAVRPTAGSRRRCTSRIGISSVIASSSNTGRDAAGGVGATNRMVSSP